MVGRFVVIGTTKKKKKQVANSVGIPQIPGVYKLSPTLACNIFIICLKFLFSVPSVVVAPVPCTMGHGLTHEVLNFVTTLMLLPSSSSSSSSTTLDARLPSPSLVGDGIKITL